MATGDTPVLGRFRDCLVLRGDNPRHYHLGVHGGSRVRLAVPLRTQLGSFGTSKGVHSGMLEGRTLIL